VNRKPLSGIFAAVPTPVDASGRPDTARFLTHARWALAKGCDGLNVLGSTGEANSLAPSARMEVMHAAATGLEPRRLMVGTGLCDLETSIALTRLAGELGFGAALVLPPWYYKPLEPAGLSAWFSALAAGSGDVPLYLYNYPQLTGIAFDPDWVAATRAAHPGRLVGAKDSSGDLDYAERLAHTGGIDVFPSSETALAEATTRGFAGVISASVNLTAPLAARLAGSPGDASLAAEVGRLRAGIASVPLVPAVKHLVGRLHGDEGFAAVLPPLAPLTPAQVAKLEPVAASLGLPAG